MREPVTSAADRLRETERRYKVGKLDGACLLGIILLLIVGLIALFSASYADSFYSYGDATRLIRQQAIFAGIGVIAMMFLSYVPYRLIMYFHRPIFLFCTVLLFLTPFIGTNNNTFATRWIRIAGITFQSSELMKISIIISFAFLAARDGEKVRKLRNLFHPYGTMIAIVVVLLYLQPHMSATLIILATAFAILFVAGMPIWLFAIAGGAVGSVMFAIGTGLVEIAQLAHVRQRLQAWLDPFLDLQGTGWQAANSFVAIGSGGFWGLGLGQGRQKHGSLSEPAKDFVFSVWCEEMGFIGAILVVLLFAFLIYRGFYIARHSRDRAGCLLAAGITAKLAIQTFMNLFVVTGIFPVTGAALPFFSYGGTALLLQLGEMGILLNISRYMRPEARETS
jgi:cell division protein FtsW